MTNRTTIRLLGRLFAAAALAALCACAPPAPPKRIFVVTIDTLRADHLGLYGYPRGTSPFLDSLGERSLVFESAFASCSHTAPSHASLFTGLQPAQHRLLQNGETLPEPVLTLATLLAARGYKTAGFTTVSFVKGLSAGFEDFSYEQTYHDSSVILDQALDWVQGQDAGASLFVWVHLFDVHQWNEDDQIDRETLREIRTKSSPQGPALEELLRKKHGTLFDGRIPKAKILRAVDRYDGQILSADRRLADFFAQLEAKGLTEDSLWVVASDHGEGLGNHDHMGHGKTIYNEQTRVPLLFYFADGRYEPRRLEGLFRLVDVAPTIAEVAGTSFDAQVLPLAGRSFLGVLADEDRPWPVETAFTQRRPADETRLRLGWEPGEVFALQSRDFKVIAKTEGEHEVYDLESDPFEQHDLARNPPAEKERRLRELVRMYREMVQQGEERLGSSEIHPEFVEELKALGYL